MDSPLTKTTTILFLVATFCLTGISSDEHDDGHHVTELVHPLANPPSQTLYLFAVQGEVLCQSCEYTGSGDLTEASPINGAVVKLECKDNKEIPVLTATTNPVGHFFLQPPDVTTHDYENCMVYLVSSPLATCNNTTNINGGITGAKLKRQPFGIFKPIFVLYAVETLAFLPKCD